MTFFRFRARHEAAWRVGRPLSATTSHLAYRPDIDGLRALAVLFVVAFHAFPNALSGGFIGVDVFFVISGYLITGILFKTLDDRTFSFANFYYRRIIRLFPALAIVLAFCAVFGWFVLLSEDYRALARDIVSGAAFISNFTLMHDAGYFDRASELKPLLHLWSLGVEEQFYLIWPAVVVLMFRNRTALGAIIFATLAASFALNLIAAFYDPVFDFYSPATRFWELMIGTIVTFAQRNRRFPNFTFAAGSRWADLQSMVGLASLIVAASALAPHTAFPGWRAIMPAIGTALILMAGPEAFINHRILSNRLAVGVGLISYPLYLWHWPLLAFAFLQSRATPGVQTRLALILLSVALAVLTYLVLERPVRRRSDTHGRLALTLCGSMAFVGLLGASLYWTNGVPTRFPVDIRALAGILDAETFFDFQNATRRGLCHDLSLAASQEDRYRRCIESKRPLIVLWGDSYAATLYPGFRKLQLTKQFGIGQLTYGHAPPFFPKGKTAANESDLYAINLQSLADVSRFHPDIIVFNWMIDGMNAKGSPEEQVKALADTMQRVAAVSPASRIVVVGPFPAWKGTLIKSMVSYWESSPTHAAPPLYMREGLVDEVKSYDAYMKEHVPPLGATYVSALDIMCNSDGCLTRTGPDPLDLTAMDSAHLTKAGSEYLVLRFADRLWALLDGNREDAGRKAR
jgi:peptidoglycan/LPS O-acetylase OafA/YrhL